MKALLLAAGEGTRLRPLTEQLPKCLVPIAGKPLLRFWLDILGKSQIPILVNLHYKAQQVSKYLKTVAAEFPQVKTVYESQLLGTAGTLLKNKSFFVMYKKLIDKFLRLDC